MSAGTTVTPTQIMAAATELLTGGGYTQVRRQFPEWDTTSARLFEDPYNVVGVAVHDTCADLLRSWADLQGSLVEAISSRVGQAESKAWDGYLVLLTSSMAPSEQSSVEAIRYDTTRLRKLIATGQDLRTAGDVERVLRPLLPFTQEDAALREESALEALPRLLAEQGVPEETTRTLIEAFNEQESPLERLHKRRRGQ